VRNSLYIVSCSFKIVNRKKKS